MTNNNLKVFRILFILILVFFIVFIFNGRELEFKYMHSSRPVDTKTLEKNHTFEFIFEFDEENLDETPLTNEQVVDEIISSISPLYPNVPPDMVKSVIWHESRYVPDAINYNGTCVGLMQISIYWHSKRAESLGVEDLFDPYGNVLVGFDILNELITKYEDPALVLMLYNMRHDDAMDLYKQGIVSQYAESVMNYQKELEGGDN